MRRSSLVYLVFIMPLLAVPSTAQAVDAPTQLTIYNGNFAVARTTIPLDLHGGVNDVLTTDVTSQLEPDSVILRDPAGKRTLHILEQNYDAGVVTQQWLLQKYEGKTIDFQTTAPQIISTASGEHTLVPAQTIPGKIIRAGEQPLIEVAGHLQFQMPGLPLFPAGTDGLLLKPTLRWSIDAASAAHFPAELDYITNGLDWGATYNVVIPESTDVTGAEKAEVLGWVTIQNNSGSDFPKATIQLMAGNVAKVPSPVVMGRAYGLAMDGIAADNALVVTQKAFDDFHLYDIHRTVALPNGESKQVQFIDAADVTVQRSYQFDASQPMQMFGPGYHNTSRDWGSTANKHVDVREEIKNSEANHLGMPLPAGRLRFYRRETTGQMQFVGESQIEHTPQDETLHLTSGQAFDVTGERKQTDFHVDNNGHNMDETFEVTLHNAKAQPVTVHAVEHLNRAQNWQITEKSVDFAKQDSSTIDFPVQVPAHGDATLTYSVHYTW